MTIERVKGHGLRAEGRTRTPNGYWAGGAGPGRCECGAVSDELPSTRRRQQWHREHKDTIRAKQAA